MDTYVIEVSKDAVDIELYRTSSLPAGELAAGIKNGVVLVGRLGGRSIAVCIIEKRGEIFEILHWAALPEFHKMGYGRELMLYALDYINVMGGRFVEMGAPNTDIQMFVLLQRLGFRVAGVRPDYYIESGKLPEKALDQLEMRDMLRYRMDLRELTENKEEI